MSTRTPPPRLGQLDQPVTTLASPDLIDEVVSELGVRRFQLHLIESGASICNRNRIMTGVRFLFRVTLRRHDLAASRTARTFG